MNEKKINFKEIVIFGIVGILNTGLSALIMFILYNKFYMGYWRSSIIAYVLASIFSFFMNKKYTFQNQGQVGRKATKFIVNIVVCYLIAYSIAQPIVGRIILINSISIKEQIAMLIGMILFTALNYIGQKYFVFK